jgi:hypothetical protein
MAFPGKLDEGICNVVSRRLPISAHRRLHPLRRASRVDDHGAAAGKIPPEPVVRAARRRSRLDPRQISDGPVRPEVLQPVHQTQQTY